MVEHEKERERNTQRDTQRDRGRQIDRDRENISCSTNALRARVCAAVPSQREINRQTKRQRQTYRQTDSDSVQLVQQMHFLQVPAP